MRVLVIGAAGMVGRKLTAALLAAGQVGGTPLSELVLADVIEPAPMRGEVALVTVAADLAEPGAAESLVVERPDLIFHLAAVVSGEAEADFEKGYRVNLDGTRNLLDAIRRAGDGYCPRVVFTSSIAVFGEPLPPVIGDDQQLAPLTSYGTQKAISELLLADYSRRGFLDGVGIRLPTIVVRPGLPNKAASGFFSGILREPLSGHEAVLPVDDSVRHWFASPRAAVGYLLHAATLDTSALGQQRSLTMPGLAATVGEEIAALERAAGPGAVALIKRHPNETIARIVAGWPQAFDASRALTLSFKADTSFDEIIRIHIEDELGGKIG